MMKDYFTIENIQRVVSSEALLAGSFGIEREGLRVKADGALALTPHPAVFGNKLTNPLITTDFSESQIEIVIPALSSVEKTYQLLSHLTDLVEIALPREEFFWPNSMPCVLPPLDQIPIAHYEGAPDAEASMLYRRGLAQKYGAQKQMLSGIHFNYSLAEETIKTLYRDAKQKESSLSYQAFKDELYLKIARNYLRYRWLIIYLSGATSAAHATFAKECLRLMPNQDGAQGHFSEAGPSYRNGTTGYKNIDPLYPRYDSCVHFADDVAAFVQEGKLSQPKELYAQVRLKPKDPRDWLHSLAKDGIDYIEMRTMDLNPFDKCGISLIDMQLMHQMMLYCLLKPESDMDFAAVQVEAVRNENLAAERGFCDDLMLSRDGEAVGFKTWALELIDEMLDMDDRLSLGRQKMLKTMRRRITHPETTHAAKLNSSIKEMSFLETNLALAAEYRIESKVATQLGLQKGDAWLAQYDGPALPGRRIAAE